VSDPKISLTIPTPDDWHVHFRDGEVLKAVVPHTVAQFGRAIIMPNLVPPVITVDAASAYRERIMAAVPAGTSFTPLMTCYLTDGASPDEMERGHREGVWVAAKLYPAHATTNSAHGVTSLDAIAPALSRMEKIGMPMLVHGEVTDADVDIFDREKVFIDRVLSEVLRRHQGLRVVMEHITTADGVAFVRDNADRMGATITPHHLVLNRNDLLVGGIRPHHYCLPVVKRETHRQALRKAATSGEKTFFLGTDTAPHAIHLKECACGCAGLFNAPTTMQVYTQVFHEENALQHLEGFASRNGPAFYGLPVNEGTMTIEQIPSTAPARVTTVDGTDIVVFKGGEELPWTVTRST
jgi:dihydroorotase